VNLSVIAIVFYEIGQTLGICSPAGTTASFR